MTSENIVDTDRIKPIVEKGVAKVIPAEYCMAFNNYLCQEYPWVPYTDRIDWDQVKKSYKRFRWKEATIEETIDFLNSTCLKNFKEICIVYGADEPGLIVPYSYACANLENLIIFGWLTRDLVGVRRNNFGVVELAQDCFVEVDFVHWLTASG